MVAIVFPWASGCITTAHNAVPVRHIPPELLATPRSPRTPKIPIDLTLLQQPSPEQYAVARGDTLGIYVKEVLGGEDQPGPIHFPDFRSPRYPGQVVTPKVGYPVEVDIDGKIQLPFVEPVYVDGMTLQQVAEAIRAVYLQKQILQTGKEYIVVTLIKPRYYRVTVVRDDANAARSPAFIRKETHVLAKRGTAEVLEMPAYENDVLHALAATGGLPGADAYNHVWVLRARPEAPMVAANQGQNDTMPEQLPPPAGPRRRIKIPLRLCPGEPFLVRPEDVILHEGDVVYIESRETEFFYVGGLLKGGQIPLPRDYDIDILGAIALANGSVAGPAGENASAGNFRRGPGNIIPPSRAIITRTISQGQQIKMSVDLKRALNDPRERVIVQPGDLVMLVYTPAELLGNIALNLVNVNYRIPYD